MSGGEVTGRTRIRVIYHGRVQGVFFRATSREIARDYDVVGFVRNLPDGTVHLEAEGPPDQVRAFLDAVANHFRANITRADEETLPAQGREARFEIRY